MKTRQFLLAGLGLTISAAANAEVLEARETSFATRSVILVDVKPDAAYRVLVNIPMWWDSEHTWSGAARNLTLEPRAGGCFCEKLAGGGSVQHARVVFVQPGRLIRLEGALGPLQEMPVTGVLTFSLDPDGPGTRITLTYKVFGGLTAETAKLAPVVDKVLDTQLGRLRDLANARARR
jgi:uncharacterized protein YndB with AHSA1/START domain